MVKALCRSGLKWDKLFAYIVCVLPPGCSRQVASNNGELDGKHAKWTHRLGVYLLLLRQQLQQGKRRFTAPREPPWVAHCRSGSWNEYGQDRSYRSVYVQQVWKQLDIYGVAEWVEQMEEVKTRSAWEYWWVLIGQLMKKWNTEYAHVQQLRWLNPWAGVMC